MKMPKIDTTIKTEELHGLVTSLMVRAGDAFNDTNDSIAHAVLDTVRGMSMLAISHNRKKLSSFEISCLMCAYQLMEELFWNRFDYIESKDIYRLKKHKSRIQP